MENSVVDLVGSLGFPIGLSLTLLYMLRSYIDKFIQIQEKTVQALETAANSAKNNTEITNRTYEEVQKISNKIDLILREKT